MREIRTYGSVRGAPSDGRPYRDPGGQLVSSGRTAQSPPTLAGHDLTISKFPCTKILAERKAGGEASHGAAVPPEA